MDNNYQNGAPQYNGGMPLRCSNCKNVSIYRFCPVCGADLTHEFILQSQRQSQSQSQSQQQQTVYNINSQNSRPISSNSAKSANSAWQYAPIMPAYLQPLLQPMPMQQYPSKRSRRSKGFVALSIIMGGLILAMLLLFFIRQTAISQNALENGGIGGFDGKYTDQIPFAPKEAAEYQYPGGVSNEEFEKLGNDMSYAHISSIIGGDGQLVNQGENLSGRPFYTCVWPAQYNQTAVVYITFTDDAVTDITLEGTL